jgi:hypothetical protein
VTISDGTYGNSQTTPLTPLYGLYDYGWSSTIYYPANIGGSKNIAHIAWYVDAFQNGYSQSGPYTFSNIKVYFAYTTLSGWSNITNVSGVNRLTGVNVAQGITSWTKVYDGPITCDASNVWEYITLTTPFSYNGTSNLVVHVENWDGSYASGYPIFHYTNMNVSTSTRTAKYGAQDGSMGPTSGTRGYSRPDIQFCEATSLPIELLYFKGSETQYGNLLEWETASEYNNDYYTIYKSGYPIDWNNITEVDGVGTSSMSHHYSYLDRDLLNDITYYYLRQTDYDGKIKEYQIISIDNRLITSELIRITNILGQDVDINTPGLKIFHYSDGTNITRY